MNTTWELRNPTVKHGRFRVAVMDFDGTVSLIRECWASLMATIGIDHLQKQELPYEADTPRFLEDQVLRLSGRPSIFQMHRVGEIITERGGTAPDPDTLLKEFTRRLYAAIDTRKRRLASGEDRPEQWTVPGTHALLTDLQSRGVTLYLVSGTDRESVLEETALLQLTDFFGSRIFAPDGSSPNFSKAAVFDHILTTHHLDPAELVSFGDGYAETVEAKRVGALAVGVASREAGLPGCHELKRAMLIELGADLILADYHDHAALVEWLFSA